MSKTGAILPILCISATAKIPWCTSEFSQNSTIWDSLQSLIVDFHHILDIQCNTETVWSFVLHHHHHASLSHKDWMLSQRRMELPHLLCITFLMLPGWHQMSFQLPTVKRGLLLPVSQVRHVICLPHENFESSWRVHGFLFKLDTSLLTFCVLFTRTSLK